MNSYIALKDKIQAEVNAFPFGFAFSEEQFKKMMKNWGLRPSSKDDLKKIYSIGSGGYIRKADAPAMDEMFARHHKWRQEAVDADETGDGYIFEMFAYELANHEYGYTYELDDTLDACGLTLKQVKADKRLRHGLNKALKKYYDFDYKV